MVGVGQSNIAGPRFTTTFRIKSRFAEQLDCQAFILPKVTGALPNLPFEIDEQELYNYKLAEPDYNRPKECDLILGVDLLDRLFLNGKIQIREKLFLKETIADTGREIVRGTFQQNHNKICFWKIRSLTPF